MHSIYSVTGIPALCYPPPAAIPFGTPPAATPVTGDPAKLLSHRELRGQFGTAFSCLAPSGRSLLEASFLLLPICVFCYSTALKR